jgi:hypothetical protein
MAKCVNCNLYADYRVEHEGAEAHEYCEAHLPWHINKKKLPAHVKNITAQPVVAPVVETPVEPVVEETKPVARPKTKKAKVQDENRTNTDETGASSSEDSAQS